MTYTPPIKSRLRKAAYGAIAIAFCTVAAVPAQAEKLIELDLPSFQARVQQQLEEEGSLPELRKAVTDAKEARRLKREAYAAAQKVKGTPAFNTAWKAWAQRAAVHYARSIKALKLQKKISKRKYDELIEQFIQPIRDKLAAGETVGPGEIAKTKAKVKQATLDALRGVSNFDPTSMIDDMLIDQQMSSDTLTMSALAASKRDYAMGIAAALKEPGFEDVPDINSTTFDRKEEQKNLRTAHKRAEALAWDYVTQHHTADTVIKIQKRYARHLLLKIQKYEVQQPRRRSGVGNIIDIVGG